MTTQSVLDLSEIKQKSFSIEQLRARLRPSDSLDQLFDCRNILINQWEDLGKNQIDAIKTRIDLELRLLNKTLPDLKVMEHGVGESAHKVNFIINLNGDKPEAEVRTL
jgi:hypothetical protein